MDESRVSGVQGNRSRAKRRTRRSPGLEVRPRNGYLHIHGTVRVSGRSVRVRRSTGLPDTPDNLDHAHEIRRQVEAEIRDEVVHGIKPSVPFAVAAQKYLTRRRKRPIGASTVRTIKELTARFQIREIRSISEQEWIEFVDGRHAGNKPETRERYLNTVVAFLSFCLAKPRRWVDEVPAFDRDSDARNPHGPSSRGVQHLRPELIMLLYEQAAPHMKGQIAAFWSTGARVSALLKVRICDVILADGRGQITMHQTKTGKPVTAALHPWSVEELKRYAEWRGGLEHRTDPFFVTHLREPYTDTAGDGGGQNKSAFKGMKRRAVKLLVDQAMRSGDGPEARRALLEDAALLSRVTNHWFRHMLAQAILSTSGDITAAKEQGGWSDVRSVLRYSFDAPEQRRRVISELTIGDDNSTSLTHDRVTAKKT